MKHKQELIDLLMADAKLQFEYADKEGNTCAIGGLAEAFGWKAKPIRDNKMGINSLFVPYSKHRMIVALRKAVEHFELTPDDLYHIQKVNDQWSGTGARHLALKELVESWEEE